MTRQISLTARLTLLFACISSLVLLGLGAVIAAAIEEHFEHQDRDALEAKARQATGLIGGTEEATALPERLHAVFADHGDLAMLVRGADGEALFATPGVRFPREALRRVGVLREAPLFEWREGERAFRGLVVAARTAPPEEARVVVAVAIPIDHHIMFLERFGRTLSLYVTGAALISGLLGWLAARRGLQPLRAMRAQVAGVTASKLDLRLPEDAVPVEMADLAAGLNRMLARLEDAFTRLSEFSSDLAHELRTPISNLMTQTQVALSQARDADAYRDILASNAEEFERLARMVGDMLFLAKADHGLLLPSREPVDIEREVAALFDFYDAVAEEAGVRLRLSGHGRIVGDRLMLRRALSNLLSNALRHTRAGAAVEVVVEENADAIVVRVENPGEGIDAAELAHVFDRFYRADKARTHTDADRTGLGLSITRAIAEAHGGGASASSADGVTRFTLSFPRA